MPESGEQGATAEGAVDDETPVVASRGSMPALTQAITRALIQRRAGELLMLHAGAVCNARTGRSVAYIAGGGTGKTTLSVLLGQDYGYLSDETVGIEPGSWRIYPYEKPLSLRTPEGGHPKSEHSPDSLGLKLPHPEPTLSTLIVMRRSIGTTTASISQPDFLDIVPELVPQTSAIVRLNRPLHMLADLAQAVGGIWLVEYAEGEQVLDWVSDQLGRP